MLHARPEELRLALLAIVSAAADKPEETGTCSQMMDAAMLNAGLAPPEALAAAVAPDPTLARLGAVNILGGLCQACGGCGRGLTTEPLDLQ